MSRHGFLLISLTDLKIARVVEVRHFASKLSAMRVH